MAHPVLRCSAGITPLQRHAGGTHFPGKREGFNRGQGRQNWRGRRRRAEGRPELHGGGVDPRGAACRSPSETMVPS